MTSILKNTADFTKNTADQGAQGVASIGKTAGNAVNPSSEQASAEHQKQQPPPQSENPGKPKEQPEAGSNDSNFLTSGLKSVGDTFSTGASAVWNPAVSAGKAGAGFLQDVGSQGFAIGEKVAKTGADVTTNVVIGAADLTGTAVGGIIAAAAETSGKVFEPVASGLKAVDGLEKLGEGLEKVNGLPVQAIQQLGSLTVKALNMSGITPTFFDPNGDGVVVMDDTIKGLIVLGLEDKYARYAAYALHGIFSYSTSSSWVPSIETKEMPIHVDKMNNTRWGRNWGTYERIDWCQDIDIDTFFDTSSESTGTFEKWQETFKKGRQYFGVLLLIFEWGTTWPFVMPPVPAQEIPFKDDIGKVVRRVILPTIFKNYKRTHGDDQHKPTKPPSEEAPADSKDA